MNFVSNLPYLFPTICFLSQLSNASPKITIAAIKIAPTLYLAKFVACGLNFARTKPEIKTVTPTSNGFKVA